MGYLATDFIHQIVKDYVKPGDICIDATAGNGNDTIFLCSLVKETGKVFAFDIQEKAVETTKKLIEKEGYLKTASIILDNHTSLDSYIKENTISCIMFNLGYLPGADHKIATKSKTTLIAIEKGLKLLKKDGLLTILIYSGKESGFEEKEVVLSYLQSLDSKKYLVIVSSYYNRPNNPPIPVQIVKLF